MNLLKRTSFLLIGVILTVLATATILEKLYGSDFVYAHVYGSALFVGLWALTALFSLVYLLKSKMQRRPYTLLLHLAFLVILAGAATTWLFSEQGSIHLRRGVPEQGFVTEEGGYVQLPFTLSLKEFEVVYYTGTQAPMDYVSRIAVRNAANETREGVVSMNNIFSYEGFRFYQSGYDDDGEGTRFAVSHDPYGITLTYIGYGLLLLSMLLFFCDKNSRFRQLLQHPVLRRQALMALLLFGCGGVTPLMGAEAEAMPKVLPAGNAAEFGQLYVLYNNRICPMQTLARDFTIKLHGSATYRGLTAEQVLTGYLFYMDSWKDEKVFKIKSQAVRRLLGIQGQYASIQDFATAYGEYKLDKVIGQIRTGEEVADKRGIEEADEKYNLILSLFSGKMLKMFPYNPGGREPMSWFAQADDLPIAIADDEYRFIRKSMSLIGEMVVLKKYDELSRVLGKVKIYQEKKAGAMLPSPQRFKAELLYNRLDYSKPLAIACICIGLIAFVWYVQMLVRQRVVRRALVGALNVLLVCPFVYLTLILALRFYISGHLPLSNGYETMQFMAWSTLLLTLLLQRKYNLIIPFGFLLSGLTLLVSMMGEANPQLTQLMPVLVSPLLSIHVVVIMVAYSLLAFMMLNGITAVLLHFWKRGADTQIERLQVISALMLYPAVFLLTLGIFVGAVWANVSWGRYWGWDPKEVWALITMLVYALALHANSLSWFRKPMFFHLFTIIAFFTVLITYFGVNLLLGGMHSYANG